MHNPEWCEGLCLMKVFTTPVGLFSDGVFMKVSTKDLFDYNPNLHRPSSFFGKLI
jgi:hypothetical protein